MLTKEVQRTTKCVGWDFQGQDVFAHYEEDDFNKTVTYDGCPVPHNKMSFDVDVGVHKAPGGGWFVNNSFVDHGFQWLSQTHSANGAMTGQRRFFETREELEYLLRLGGFQPVQD